MPLVERSCGCIVDYNLSGCGPTNDLGQYSHVRIVYCSMHEAAPKMLKALTKMQKRIEFDSVTHWHTIDDPEKLLMDAAIDAARQKRGNKETN